jgi:hypothetical protein
MLQPLHCQLHEPGYQQGKTVGQQEENRPAGIAAAERTEVWD